MVFLFLITFMPVMKIVTATRIEISPIDWKKKSEITLPLNPSIFLISFSPVNMKFGSSGEWLIKDIKRSKPSAATQSPKSSIKRFITKSKLFLAIFFISIK